MDSGGCAAKVFLFYKLIIFDTQGGGSHPLEI
jgi:hypothetical protein